MNKKEIVTLFKSLPIERKKKLLEGLFDDLSKPMEAQATYLDRSGSRIEGKAGGGIDPGYWNTLAGVMGLKPAINKTKGIIHPINTAYERGKKEGRKSASTEIRNRLKAKGMYGLSAEERIQNLLRNANISSGLEIAPEKFPQIQDRIGEYLKSIPREQLPSFYNRIKNYLYSYMAPSTSTVSREIPPVNSAPSITNLSPIISTSPSNIPKTWAERGITPETLKGKERYFGYPI